MSPGTPLTLCPVHGWHRQQHHCQGGWGAPSQRGQLVCLLQPGKVDQTWVHPSSCSGWRSLREGRLAEASVQQIQHTSSSRPHTLGKPCMKPETPSNASRTQKQGCVPKVSSFLISAQASLLWMPPSAQVRTAVHHPRSLTTAIGMSARPAG